MIIQENQISCTQTSIFIQKKKKEKFTKMLCIHKCTPKKNKSLNFMHSKMHFHSNQKFKFNQKFHAFINASFKIIKNEISYVQTGIFNQKNFQKIFSCILTCIFQKEANQKFIFKQISCIETRNFQNSYSTKSCIHT